MDKEIYPIIIDAADIDYEAYARFQKECYVELFKKYDTSSDYMTAGFFRWKYNTAYGKAKVAISYKEDKIVGANVFLPALLATPAGQVLIWQSGDSAVAVGHRRMNLAYKSVISLCETIGKNDVAFGLPNPGMLTVSNKAGFKALLEVPVYASHKWIPSITTAKNSIKEVNRFSVDFDNDFYRPKLERNIAYTVKNAAILNWRYLENPIHKYRIFESRSTDGSFEGYVITRELVIKGRQILAIMELRGKSIWVLGGLLNYIRGNTSSKFLVLLSSCYTIIEALTLGLIKIPEFINPKRQIITIRDKNNMASNYYWHIGTGDWDGF